LTLNKFLLFRHFIDIFYTNNTRINISQLMKTIIAQISSVLLKLQIWAKLQMHIMICQSIFKHQIISILLQQIYKSIENSNPIAKGCQECFIRIRNITATLHYSNLTNQLICISTNVTEHTESSQLNEHIQN